jgi:glycogen debranching enzyme
MGYTNTDLKVHFTLNYPTGYTRRMVTEAQKERLRKASLDVLLMNRRVTEGNQYTVPSPSTYPFQWLWDSCFHAIVLSQFNIDDAKKEIRSLLTHQFEDGMLPHMIYWEPASFVSIPWGKEHTSSITQPPLIAEAVWDIYERDKDAAFLKEVYTSLNRYYTYLISARDPRRNNLVGIINPDESGEDNSPRFDLPLGLTHEQTLPENFGRRLMLVAQLQSCNFDAAYCMKQYFWVKDVPFNAILAKNLEYLARIAETLDLPHEAGEFRKTREKMIAAMRARMLEDGLFWSTNGADYTKLKVKTWGLFAPLYAGILTKDEAARLVERHLLNAGEFKTPFMVPTVARSEPSYDPRGMWRGPVWMSTNWFIYRGLVDYGFDDVAETVLDASVSLLEKSGFREFFHPENGNGLGAKNFTWGSLVVDMFTYTPRTHA